MRRDSTSDEQFDGFYWWFLILAAVVLILLSGGCMSRVEHEATLTALEGPALRVSDEYVEFSRLIAGDNDGDGAVTDADDFAAARAKLPFSADPRTPMARDVWLKARLRRDAELRGVFEDVRNPTSNPSGGP